MKLRCLLIVLLLSLCLSPLAPAETLPDLDTALRMAETSDLDKIELDPAGFSVYDPDNIEDFDFGEFKMIILERKFPEKAFTSLDSGYPDTFVDHFPDDFNGIDMEEPVVWLRLDIMRALPARFRATSLQEADVIFIAENEYVHDGLLSVYDYTDEEEVKIPPDIDSVDALRDYLVSEQKTVKAITLYPKFGVYSLLDAYDPVTKFCLPYKYAYTHSPRFARNPDAADLWSDIQDLDSFESFLTDAPEADLHSRTPELLEQLSGIPDKTLSLWKTCIRQGEYEAVRGSAEITFWQMVSQLAGIDSDPEHQRLYRLILKERDRDTLFLTVNVFDYSGFDTPIDVIGQEKRYMATFDPQWYEDVLADLVSTLSEQSR